MRSVLVGSDLGPGSDAVVRGAAALAFGSGAPLHVVHALGWIGMPLREAVTALQAGGDGRARRALEEQIDRVLGRGSDSAVPAVEYRCAPLALLERARELDPGVVVVGAAGTPGAGEHPSGTTLHVAARSTRPVLVLREPFRWPPRSVLCTAEEHDASGDGLRHARDWLRRACPAPPPRGRPVELQFLHAAPPAEHVLERAERHGPDLILLHRHVDASTPFRDRAWHQLLLRSPCPVCVLPEIRDPAARRVDTAREQAPEDDEVLAGIT